MGVLDFSHAHMNIVTESDDTSNISRFHDCFKAVSLQLSALGYPPVKGQNELYPDQ